MSVHATTTVDGAAVWWHARRCAELHTTARPRGAPVTAAAPRRTAMPYTQPPPRPRSGSAGAPARRLGRPDPRIWKVPGRPHGGRVDRGTPWKTKAMKGALRAL